MSLAQNAQGCYVLKKGTEERDVLEIDQALTNDVIEAAMEAQKQEHQQTPLAIQAPKQAKATPPKQLLAPVVPKPQLTPKQPPNRRTELWKRNNFHFRSSQSAFNPDRGGTLLQGRHQSVQFLRPGYVYALEGSSGANRITFNETVRSGAQILDGTGAAHLNSPIEIVETGNL